MDPYARPDERRIGTERPRVKHLPPQQAMQHTTRERQAAKDEVVTARRAIKKSARRYLRQQLQAELNQTD